MKSARPCQVCQNWIQTLLDNECWVEPAPAVGQHLASCPVCRERLAAAQALLLAIRYWSVPEPATPPNRIVARVLVERQEQSRDRLRWLLAASLLLVGLAWWPMTALREPGPIADRWAAADQRPGSDSLAANAGKVSESVDLAQARAFSPSDSAIEDETQATEYPVRELAYWFLPGEVRETVEGVFDALAPVLVMSREQMNGPGWPPALPPLDTVWDPVWDAGRSSWRLFRNMIPPLLDQPSS